METMKQSVTIVEAARNQVMSLIRSTALGIILRRIELGEEDPINIEDEDRDAFYVITVRDYNVLPLKIDANVMDTYTLDIYTESREVEDILIDPEDNEVYLRLEGMDLDEEDPIHIHALSTDDLKWVACELDDIFKELKTA